MMKMKGIEYMMKFRLIVLVLLLATYNDNVWSCEQPISDRELLKKYKPCDGGWCLRK